MKGCSFGCGRRPCYNLPSETRPLPRDLRVEKPVEGISEHGPRRRKRRTPVRRRRASVEPETVAQVITATPSPLLTRRWLRHVPVSCDEAVSAKTDDDCLVALKRDDVGAAVHGAGRQYVRELRFEIGFEALNVF